MSDAPKNPVSLSNLRWILRHPESFEIPPREKIEIQKLLGCLEKTWNDTKEDIAAYVRKLEAEASSHNTEQKLTNGQTLPIGTYLKSVTISSIAKLVGMRPTLAKKKLLEMREERIVTESETLGIAAAIELVNVTYMRFQPVGKLQKHEHLFISEEALNDFEKRYASRQRLQQENLAPNSNGWHSPSVIGTDYGGKLGGFIHGVIDFVNKTITLDKARDIISEKLFHKETNKNGEPGAWRISTAFVGMVLRDDTPITSGNIREMIIPRSELIKRIEELAKAVQRNGGKPELELYEKRGLGLISQPSYYKTASTRGGGARR